MGCGLLFGIFFFFFGTASSQFLQQESYDYCDPKLKLCEVFTDHTMCKYPVPGLSPQCKSDIQEPLSATEKKRILFWHNKFRSNVASGTERNKNRKLPTSSNMRQIYWDKELETIATRWAEQCMSTNNPNVYDKCRNTKRFQVSQNVGTRKVNGTFIDKQAPQITIMWYKESKDFDPSLIDKFEPVGEDKKNAKQFANMIWAETYALGCARVILQEQLPPDEKDPAKTSVWTIERLICNYGPGGNEIGKPVYKRGASCENCPNGTQCSQVFQGLCAVQNEEKLESQQILENQDSKENATTTDSEILTQETDFSTETSVIKENQNIQTEEPMTEENEESSTPFNSRESFSEVEDKSESEITTQGDCRGDNCPNRGEGSSPKESSSVEPKVHLNEIIKYPKQTARKKSKNLEKKALSYGHVNDVIINEKRKWRVSEGRKAIRDVSGQRKSKNGKACQCYEVVEEADNGSPSRGSIIFPLFFLSLLLRFIL